MNNDKKIMKEDLIGIEKISFDEVVEDFIPVPINEYNRLIRQETKLDVVMKAFERFGKNSYKFDELLETIHALYLQDAHLPAILTAHEKEDGEPHA